MTTVPVEVAADPDDESALQCWVRIDALGVELRCLLDTGARVSAVPATPPFTAAEVVGERTGRGVSGTAQTSRLIAVPGFRIGELVLDEAVVEVQPEDWLHPPLLGVDAFAATICRFRFGSGRIDLLDEADAPALSRVERWGDGWAPSVRLVWPDRVTAAAIWDTGAGVSLVDRSWAEAHPSAVKIGEPSSDDQGTDSTGAAVASSLGTLHPFTIDGRSFPGGDCVVVDLSPLNATLDEPITMFLGLPLIVTTDWLLDVAGHRIAPEA